MTCVLYHTGHLDLDNIYMTRFPFSYNKSLHWKASSPPETKNSTYQEKTTLDIKTSTHNQNISTLQMKNVTSLQSRSTLKIDGNNRNITIVTLYVNLKKFKVRRFILLTLYCTFYCVPVRSKCIPSLGLVHYFHFNTSKDYY